MGRIVKRTVQLLGALAVLLALFLGGGYFASQRAPEFYTQAIQAPAPAQQQASDELLENAAALASQVQQPGRWQATFSQEQLNGWLAYDLPRNHGESLPPEFSEPRIELQPGRILLACRYAPGEFSTVLSLQIEPYLIEPNVLAVRIAQARAGALPLPLDQVLSAVSEACARMNVHVRWQQADGDPVAVVELATLGDAAEARVLDTLEIRDDAIVLSGETSPRR